MIYPFDPSYITDRWGWRVKPCDTCSAFHEGVDFNPGYGTNIPSVMDGTVIEAEYSGSLGEHVYIDDGYGMITMYGHMISGSIQVAVGEKVKQGQIIGQVGNTGSSTGAHLHFAIKLDGAMVDPLPLLQKYAH
jgi:murein DD-endopeptidase MepM/ murein hydrolase activator NlpD